eukprot:GHRQ01003848.1.p2 GENE.GHRQ01003848.1~~GHRQ01003848.1.p2  ORF type:complete len:387 (-),score=87.07 GHRQ01003848.1:4127-5287(-)
MEMDETRLAQDAGAATSGQQMSARARKALAASAKLGDADVQILDKPSSDMFVEELRKHGNSKLADIFALVPQEKRCDVEPALRQYTASVLGDASFKDFNLRAGIYADKVGDQAKRVLLNTPSCGDSPGKVKSASVRLFEPKTDIAVAKMSLDSLLAHAADLLKQENMDAGGLALELEQLLLSHKQAKKSRAADQDFAQHINAARNKILKAISAARDRGKNELAYELLEALRHHEAEVNKFFSLSQQVSFEAARDAYLNKSNPLGGMSEEAWQLATSLAANNDHRKLFNKLLGKKNLILPGGSNGKKKKRAAEPDTEPSDSDTSSSDDEKPKPKSRKSSKPGGRREPFCRFCGGKHYQAKCYQWKASQGSQHTNGKGFKQNAQKQQQ